jgi:hypothetical protein
VATGVRLPPDLRDALTREAFIHQRSLTQEILSRLRASFSEPEVQARVEAMHRLADQGTIAGTLRASERPAGGVPAALGESQRLLLTYFNALPPDRQLALLTLLRR